MLAHAVQIGIAVLVVLAAAAWISIPLWVSREDRQADLEAEADRDTDAPEYPL